jgi:hypothetical protein
MMRPEHAYVSQGHELIQSSQLWGRAAYPVVAGTRPGPVVGSGGVDVDFACHPGPVQQDSDGGSD